eukprot:CAMPEP_0197060486 /NCGR_PEP_ID=MMETSP1384-20130603/127684_1 /TAXON_ID=29189 /ORGANISM="Ammonia sp." /LENGTH=217 /DNA_ID=CAMNT_0042495843 /DNA_START=75 /DNA_END=724 /DNA_ORIENTATION=-
MTCSYAYQYLERDAQIAGSQHLKSELYLLTTYNQWTYSQIEKWCKQNIADDTAKYTANTGIPFRSIRNTLCHLWMADQILYNKMFGLNQAKYVTYKGKQREADMRELYSYWTTGHENDGQFERFCDGLSMEEIFDIVHKSSARWVNVVESFTNDEQASDLLSSQRDGKPFSQTKASLIEHAVNHATHHRGQISAAATILCPDAKPITLDLAWYQRWT